MPTLRALTARVAQSRARHDRGRPHAGARLGCPAAAPARCDTPASPKRLAAVRPPSRGWLAAAKWRNRPHAQRLLNTIYVTSEGAWLRKDGANLVVEVDGAERGRAPLHMLEGVVGFGRAAPRRR